MSSLPIAEILNAALARGFDRSARAAQIRRLRDEDRQYEAERRGANVQAMMSNLPPGVSLDPSAMNADPGIVAGLVDQGMNTQQAAADAEGMKITAEGGNVFDTPLAGMMSSSGRSYAMRSIMERKAQQDQVAEAVRQRSDWINGLNATLVRPLTAIPRDLIYAPESAVIDYFKMRRDEQVKDQSAMARANALAMRLSTLDETWNQVAQKLNAEPGSPVHSAIMAKAQLERESLEAEWMAATNGMSAYQVQGRPSPSDLMKMASSGTAMGEDSAEAKRRLDAAINNIDAKIRAMSRLWDRGGGDLIAMLMGGGDPSEATAGRTFLGGYNPFSEREYPATPEGERQAVNDLRSLYDERTRWTTDFTGPTPGGLQPGADPRRNVPSSALMDRESMMRQDQDDLMGLDDLDLLFDEATR